jgi:hypothetical protein
LVAHDAWADDERATNYGADAAALYAAAIDTAALDAAALDSTTIALAHACGGLRAG